MLFAWITYKSGKGEKGSLKWKANVQITKALEKAFYLSFKVDSVEKLFSTKKQSSGIILFVFLYFQSCFVQI